MGLILQLMKVYICHPIIQNNEPIQYATQIIIC